MGKRCHHRRQSRCLDHPGRQRINSPYHPLCGYSSPRLALFVPCLSLSSCYILRDPARPPANTHDLGLNYFSPRRIVKVTSGDQGSRYNDLHSSAGRDAPQPHANPAADTKVASVVHPARARKPPVKTMDADLPAMVQYRFEQGDDDETGCYSCLRSREFAECMEVSTPPIVCRPVGPGCSSDDLPLLQYGVHTVGCWKESVSTRFPPGMCPLVPRQSRNISALHFPKDLRDIARPCRPPSESRIIFMSNYPRRF